MRVMIFHLGGVYFCFGQIIRRATIFLGPNWENFVPDVFHRHTWPCPQTISFFLHQIWYICHLWQNTQQQNIVGQHLLSVGGKETV